MEKFKLLIKRLLRIIPFLGLAVLFTIVLSSAVKKQNDQICSGLEIKIDYETGLLFLDEQDILNQLEQHGYNSVTGVRLEDLNYAHIENTIKKDSYVKSCELYSDLNGKLILEVEQKQPFLRIINNTGVSYYVTEGGEKIPLSDKFTPNLLLVTGFAGEDLENSYEVWGTVHSLAREILSDELFESIIDQIYITEEGDIELISILEDHTIILGTPGDPFEERLEKLKIFYLEGLTNAGWKQYDKINLKYKDQIVCS